MYNILICDDDIDIVNALKIYLTPEGYTLYALTDTAPGTLRLLEGQYSTTAKSSTELPSNISSDYDFIVIIGDTTETTE